MSTHLVTGVTGQDGILLAQLLRAEGGRVIGTCRPGSPARAAMAPYLEGVEIVELDLQDQAGFARLVESVEPDEVYNLAAMSSVGLSWSHAEEAIAVNGTAVAQMLQTLAPLPGVRFLQASSAEQDGDGSASPYAQGKSLAQDSTRTARDDGRFACSAILHIHESPLRRPSFVVRKITRTVAEIALGKTDQLTLGTLDVRRDWGSAVDSVAAMRLIIRADEPGDFVVATGESRGLRDVVETAFAAAGINEPWGYVSHDASLTRPADAADLVGDATPLRESLGWRPRQSFASVIEDMVRVDLERIATGVEESASYLTGLA